MRKKALGTYDIAKIIQVAPITVGRWVEEGKLPHFTTGGGHRRVWEEDLVKFLKTHNYPVPKNLKFSTRPIILVVEDDSTARKMMVKTLEKGLSSIQIEEAVDGYETGEKISSLIPALVILDFHLPGLDGFKVCESIRGKRSLKGIKILAMTEDPGAETKDKILKAGADAFLSKPFGVESFLKIVGRLLSHS